MVVEPCCPSHPTLSPALTFLSISNLPALQNLIKRDPAGYADDFRTQWNSYESARRIIELGIAGGAGGQEGDGRRACEAEERWRELVSFIAQVAPCYPTETAAFPGHITSILLNSHASLSPDTRKTLIQSLVLLRSRDMISGIECVGDIGAASDSAACSRSSSRCSRRRRRLRCEQTGGRTI